MNPYTPTKTHTNTTHLLSQADSWLPEPRFWFHMAISSITAYTSEMDNCCWEPEVPSITEPSHPFTCRSMGQLLKWLLEMCVIQPRPLWSCTNSSLTHLIPSLSYQGRPLSPRLFVWEMDSETRLWTGPVSRIKVWWQSQEEVLLARVLYGDALINRLHGKSFYE